MAGVVHMHDGLDGQHGAEQRRGGADTAAPLQMVQIVHGEPVADPALGLLGKGVDLLQRLAGFLLPGAEIHQQSLAQRGAQGVHHPDLRVRELALQLFGGDNGGLVGGGQGGGEGNAQNVFSALQDAPHFLFKGPHADRGGGGGLSIADPGVEVPETDVPAVQEVVIRGAAHLQTQRQDLQAQFLRHASGQITAAVCQNHIITHVPRAPSPFSPLFFP